MITAEPVKRHSLKEILVVVFSSTLLKLSAETEKNSNKLVLPFCFVFVVVVFVFFSLFFFSFFSLFFSLFFFFFWFGLETSFNGGHGHMT